MTGQFVLSEGGVDYETVEAEDLAAALEEAKGNVSWSNYDGGDEPRSLFIEVGARDAETGERDSATVILDPDPPSCAEGHEHEWSSPHDIVGGIESNPGVWGSGGGVKMDEVCRWCGTGKHVDTWATNPTNGTQGHTVTSYVEGEYADELETKYRRVAILVDDVAIGDGQTEDEARADVDESCILEGYEEHERVAETYDSRTHEVGMGPDGYVVLRDKADEAETEEELDTLATE